MDTIASRARRWRRRTAVLGAAACLAGAALDASGVAGADNSNQPSGQFSFTGHLLTGCPVGAVLCTHVTLTGGVSGTGTLSLLTLIPSVTVGVDYFDGKLALNTADGKFNCDLNGALDMLPSRQGEFGEICVITGGTGKYAHATGHLRMSGLSTFQNLVIPSGSGDYKGQVNGITPIPN
jgi:hypothetical protein